MLPKNNCTSSLLLNKKTFNNLNYVKEYAQIKQKNFFDAINEIKQINYKKTPWYNNGFKAA